MEQEGGTESYTVNFFTIIEVFYPSDQALRTTELCNQKSMNPHSTRSDNEFCVGVIISISIPIG